MFAYRVLQLGFTCQVSEPFITLPAEFPPRPRLITSRLHNVDAGSSGVFSRLQLLWTSISPTAEYYPPQRWTLRGRAFPSRSAVQFQPLACASLTPSWAYFGFFASFWPNPASKHIMLVFGTTFSIFYPKPKQKRANNRLKSLVVNSPKLKLLLVLKQTR